MKKKFLSLQEAFSQISKKNLSLLDEVHVYHIFLIWIGLIVFFGTVYHFFSGNNGSLFSTIAKTPVSNIFDSIYFSFITATSTGFGDIVPQGWFGILAIIEVTLGLLLLAFVTSKLVSIKQNLILGEIYELSFMEKINRLRSSLLLFRQHLSRTIMKVESKYIRKREISDLYIYIHSLETALEEIIPLIKHKGKHSFTKVIDPVNKELLVNSIVQSFEKLLELLVLLSESDLEWNRPVTISTIQRCLNLNSKLFSLIIIPASKKTDLTDVITDNERIIEEIKELL